MIDSRSKQVSRRDFLGVTSLAAFGFSTGAATALAAAGGTNLTADQGLQRLIAGNARFVGGAMECKNVSDARRAELASGQAPFALVLSCADSRVPPELVFDQGLGDIFVVRVAGNIASPAAIGSIEYAVEHLHVPLILVLGHDKCGAVAATIDIVKTNGHAAGQVQFIVDAITPAVKRAQGQTGDLLDNAIRDNVSLVASALRASQPILAPAVGSGKLKIVGGVYRFSTGVVDLMGEG